MNAPLTERHSQDIKGVISCFDRIVIRGSFERICYAQAMENYLYSSSVRLVDYQKHVANDFRLEMVAQVKRFAKEKRVEIEHVQACEYSGKATVFRGDDNHWTRQHPTLGWSEWIKGDLETVAIAGTHHNTLQEPQVADLGRKLSSTLEDSDKEA